MFPVVTKQLNNMQEAEFHLSVYHYFSWRAYQEKQKEDSQQQMMTFCSPQIFHHPTSVVAVAGNNNNNQQQQQQQQPPNENNVQVAVVDPNVANQTIDNHDKPEEEKKTEEEKDSTGASATIATATEKLTTPNKNVATTTTTTTTTTPATPRTKRNSDRFQAVVDVLLEQFPQQLANFPPNNPMMMYNMPPVISTLYFDYPGLQAQLYTARTKITELQTALDAAHKRQEITNSKHGLPLSTLPKKKKPRIEKQMGSPGEAVKKSMSISNRTDVPDDVKQLIATFRHNANKQKAKEKKRIAKLEARVEKEREKAEEAAKVAKEAKQHASAIKQQPSNTDINRKVPPPPGPYKANATFEERVKELEHFRAGNGHCRVPLRQPGLGRWVGEMRATYKLIQLGKEDNVLTKENIKILDDMGFEWVVSKPSVPWAQRYEELLSFKEQQGHTNVPRGYKPNPPLGEWVHLQRKLYRQQASIIMGDRVQKLEEIGFDWNPGSNKPSFEDRLDECREFRRKHGHLKVPAPIRNDKSDEDSSSTYESNEQRSFILWAWRQREEKRKFEKGMKSSLDRNRIRKLDEIGFDWKVERPKFSGIGRGSAKNEATFDARVSLLREIRDQYGECNTLTTLRTAGHSETSSLYQWVKMQRKQYKCLKAGKWSSLTDVRIAKLSEIGFDFEPRKHYGSRKTEGNLDETPAELDDSDLENDDEPTTGDEGGFARFSV